MGRMADEHLELVALREATRVRLSTKAVKALREHAEFYDVLDTQEDKLVANGLGVLLDMHDKLEAIRRGQA